MANAPQFRGLDKKHEQDPRLLIRDTRTVGMRIYDFLNNPACVCILLVCLATTVYVAPALADLCLVLGIGFFLYGYPRKATLPFRMPMIAKRKDYNDPYPSSVKPRVARGICFLGNHIETNEELWFTNEDMRTHVLIFGSTGSGKTEALVSFAFNALVQGSGFIYVDGKGDNSLFSKVFSMARRMGREDDLLIVNFMTGARDIIGPQRKRLSNTMNPFCQGSSSMLAELVVSLMDQAAATPDGDMWKGRAISFVQAIMKVLVYARDTGMILLDANTVRNYFSLEKIEAIAIDHMLPRYGQEPISLEKAPRMALEPIEYYIDNLPGYDKAKKGKQVSQVLEQHGFITMQLTRVFTSLADTYGHILRTNLAEVDMRDVVLNRRILVVLLPALEKSPDELSNLGKVIIATLKAMMAAGLGSEVEGSYTEVIQRKPTNAPTPFMCVLDEYGYYAVAGFAVVPAQARSLGFSAIFAGQDLPAFQKVSKEEAMSIGANTNIKIAMKIEDPVETWEFFSKTAGEAYVTKVDAFQTNAASLTVNYLDTRSASAEKRARIDLLDLKDQGLGEAHIFFKSKIIRARTFFVDPPPVKHMRLNHFLKVEKPLTRVSNQLLEQFENFENALNVKGKHIAPPEPSEELTRIFTAFDEHAADDPIERGVSALLASHEEAGPVMEDVVEEVDDESSIFMQVNLNDDVLAKLDLQTKEWPPFEGILLRKAPTLDQVGYLERLTGKSSRHAENIAMELIKDMEQATFYPPEISDQPDGDTLAANIIALCGRITDKKVAALQEETT